MNINLEVRTIENHRINEEIRVPRVLVINAQGEKIGIMTPSEAMRIAMSEDLDLVEVSPSTDPPVCRIMDFGKYKYKQKKRKRMSKKTNYTVVKEIRLRPKIEQHDLEIKVKRATDFLSDGHRVQLNMMFKGREMAHSEFGFVVFEKFVELLGDDVKIERPARLEGRRITALIAPKGK